MGTVGLSFGSPTSGTGFNVSTTVASIISNLQSVETPWKKQLTSLESQDTAISSLGTLFSNLSNDLSSLTDFQGILTQKTGSSSNTNVLQLTAATDAAVAGTHTVVVNSLAQTSSGYMAAVANASDTLTGSITLQVGSGTARTITLNSSDNTLTGLASAINASSAGITASVLTDANGSRLSLVSSTSGTHGNIVVSSNSLAAAAANTLSYSGTAGSSSVTSAGTLSPVASLSHSLSGSMSIQVGSGSAQTVNLSDVNTAEGGTTLSNLESYINSNTSTLGVTASVVTNSDGTSSLTGANASLNVDGIALSSASNTVNNLIPGITFQLLGTSPTPSGGSAEQVQVVIGNNNTGVESTVNQMVSDYNSLISAVNTQQGNTSSGTPEPLFGSPTLSLLQQQLLSGLNIQSPNGYIDPIASTGTTLSGSLSLQVGSGTAENIVIGAAPSSPAANTIYTGSGVNTIPGLAAAINSAKIGVNAAVVTSNGQATLTLTSQTEGAAGSLVVNSSLNSVKPTSLSYSDTGGYTSSTADNGTFGNVASAGDMLSGTMTIQVGSGSPQTITLDSSDNTLAGLLGAINGLSGVSAALNTAGTGLILTSATDGAAGALSVTSTILDTTNTTTTALNYNTSSDVNNLTDLGISVNNDGSLTFDAAISFGCLCAADGDGYTLEVSPDGVTFADLGNAEGRAGDQLLCNFFLRGQWWMRVTAVGTGLLSADVWIS